MPKKRASPAVKKDPRAGKGEEVKHTPHKRAVAGLRYSHYQDVRILGGDGIHDPFIQKYMGIDIKEGYAPRMSQVPINVTRKGDGTLKISKYTAADRRKDGIMAVDERPDIFTGAVNKTQKKIIWPKYYQNPYQYQDMVYLQDIYANTICGRIFDMVAFFALASGVRPKLRVRNESQYTDDDAKIKDIGDHKWMIDELHQIEKEISKSNTGVPFGDSDSDAGDTGRTEYPVGPMGTAESPAQPAYDTSLQKKWFAAFINTMMFGREMIVPRIDPADNTVQISEGEKYKNIPKIMMVIHPRDMGFNYVDYMTHRLLGIQLNNSNWILRPDEMIFWEWMPDNPVYGSKFYGMSAAQSMMGSARTLRRMIEVDFPLIAKTRWSGMYWLVFKRKGEETQTSDDELASYLSRVELNGINATLEDNPAEDFMVHKIDLDPKIEGLLQTTRELIQYMMSQVGMPQGLLYGEDNLNRDTLKAKISAWTRGALKRYRQPFLDAITDQWYGRLGATLAAQSEKWKKALESFEIIATVDEFQLENREDLLRVMMMLENVTGAWTDKARAEFLEMEDLQQKIDADKAPEDVPPMPGGGGMGGGGMKVTDDKGRKYGVEGDVR